MVLRLSRFLQRRVCQGDASLDDCQNVVEVVGDTSGQRAQRCQGLIVQQLMFHAKPIGDVPGDVEGACRLSVVPEALAAQIQGSAVPITCQNVDGPCHTVPASDFIVGPEHELAAVRADDVKDAATKQVVLFVPKNRACGLVDKGHLAT